MFTTTSTVRIAAVAALGLSAFALAAAPRQQPGPQRKPAPRERPPATAAPDAQRELRYAPSLAVLMVAYEGLLANDEKTNPEMVRAMKRSFERNPSARRTFDRIHKAYRALDDAQRTKIVGNELAQANGATKLDRQTLEPIFGRHFKRQPFPLASAFATTVRDADMKAVELPDVEAKDAAAKVPDKPFAKAERLIGREADEGHSTTYKVEHTGLYCVREPSDFGLHCEPYVVYTMRQGDSGWTATTGPREDCDSGDLFRNRKTLRGDTPFNRELHVVATCFEHDLGSIAEIEDAISSGVDVLAEVVGIWWDVPSWLRDAVTDVLTWFADLFGLEDDQIGSPVAFRFDRAFAQSNTSHNTWRDVDYDIVLRCTGNMRGSIRQRGDFKLFLNVTPLP
jgi:hypothetical protein